MKNNSKFSKILEALSGACLIAVCLVFRPFVRRWYSSWGATEEEVKMTLPGDEFIKVFRGGYTQAISIGATPDEIWPWLVQVGQNKGGFYSYELLENLIGCDIHNVDRIIPEHQHIKIGDGLRMHPRAPDMPVVVLQHGRAIAYGGKVDENTASIWAFYLRESDNGTRLISRWAFDYEPRFTNKLIYNFIIEPIASVMQRKMLMGIKQRVEGKVR